MIAIDDRSSCVVAHSAGTQQVHGKALLPNRNARNTLSASGFHDLDSAILHEARVREIVRMILVGDPDRGSAPGVLESGIQANRIRGYGQRSTVAQEIHG